MDVFVGRQPILDGRQRTVAYELLFRSGIENRYDAVDGDLATATVISNTVLTLGCGHVLGERLGFINFPRRALIDDQALMLPSNKIVIEILETVNCDDEVVASCRRLKAAGFRLALDDIVSRDQAAPLIPFATFAKMDFTILGQSERRDLARHFRDKGLVPLAEKVETKDDFQSATRDGYSLFQGYFFARPEILTGQDIPAYKLNCLRLLNEVNRPTLRFRELEQLLRLDISLVTKLLRFVNSAVFSLVQPVQTISGALVSLGEDNVRRVIALATLPALATDKPSELIKLSLVRARFCELAAKDFGVQIRSSDCFLMGLFSLLDTIIGRPINELLAEISVASDVARAIEGTAEPDNRLQRLLCLAKALERSDFNTSIRLAEVEGSSGAVAAEHYFQAMVWVDAFAELH